MDPWGGSGGGQQFRRFVYSDTIRLANYRRITTPILLAGRLCAEQHLSVLATYWYNHHEEAFMQWTVQLYKMLVDYWSVLLVVWNSFLEIGEKRYQLQACHKSCSTRPLTLFINYCLLSRLGWNSRSMYMVATLPMQIPKASWTSAAFFDNTWWRYQMEILFGLLALFAGNSPFTLVKSHHKGQLMLLWSAPETVE